MSEDNTNLIFEPFPKIPRLRRECVVTEKIDGTNAQILITEDGQIIAGSRNRFITPQSDNHGFATWVEANEEKLISLLGPGRHFGEWWGRGIQRGYNQIEKHFSLFNVNRWQSHALDLVPLLRVVPVLYRGVFDLSEVDRILNELKEQGSVAAPGYPFPEGVVVYHKSSRTFFKRTIEHDEEPKGRNRNDGASGY